MASVWVIDDEEPYENYIAGVFSTRENAELVQGRIGGKVMEWPLDPGVEGIRQGMSRYSVLMLKDGTVTEAGEIEPTQWNRKDIEESFFGPNEAFDKIHAMVWARSAQHAIEIVNEKRAQMIAEGRW